MYFHTSEYDYREIILFQPFLINTVNPVSHLFQLQLLNNK